MLLFSCLVTKFFTISFSFVLLSSLSENGECYKVSRRQSNEDSEHILSFIGSFSDVVESVILQFFLLASLRPPFSPVDIYITIEVAVAVAAWQ